MDSRIAAEVRARTARGFPPKTIAQIRKEILEIGYRIDRRLDAMGKTRILTGERAGESYPCITTGIVEADTGRSAFHFAARRDANFARLQDMRLNESHYAIVKGSIFDL